MKVAVKRTVLNEEAPVTQGFTLDNRTIGEYKGLRTNNEGDLVRVVAWDTGYEGEYNNRQWKNLEVVN